MFSGMVLFLNTNARTLRYALTLHTLAAAVFFFVFVYFNALFEALITLRFFDTYFMVSAMLKLLLRFSTK